MAINITELNFGYDEFSRPKTFTGFDALAKMVLNLIVMNPGTIPSCPEMGVGIEMYKMEYNTTETLNTIREAVISQINDYIPDYFKYIKNIVVEPIPSEQLNGDDKGIYIGAIVTDIDNPTRDMTIVFRTLNANNTIITDYVIV